jgi:hypothetical protein
LVTSTISGHKENLGMLRLLFATILLIVGQPSFAQRITLASHAPIMAISQPSRSTLYIDCWKHHNNDGLTYFDGTSDVNVPISNCEISIPLQASGNGVLNANDVFDVVYTPSGACVVTNGSGGGWTADGGSLGARGTGYSAIDDQVTRGYPTNANAIAHCYHGSTDYGPIAANQASLQGSVCTDPTAPGSVSFIPGFASIGGGAARLCVSNVDDDDFKTEVTDTNPNCADCGWTFAGYCANGEAPVSGACPGSTIVGIENLDNPVAGGVGNQIVFLSTLARHFPKAGSIISLGSSVAYQPAYCGIGISLDHGGSSSPDRLAEYLSPSGGAVAANGVAWGEHSTGEHIFPAVTGLHYVQAQETTDGLARCWFRTVNGQRSGLTFEFRM